jgi:hypothetical protein
MSSTCFTAVGGVAALVVTAPGLFEDEEVKF